MEIQPPFTLLIENSRAPQVHLFNMDMGWGECSFEKVRPSFQRVLAGFLLGSGRRKLTLVRSAKRNFDRSFCFLFLPKEFALFSLKHKKLSAGESSLLVNQWESEFPVCLCTLCSCLSSRQGDVNHGGHISVGESRRGKEDTPSQEGL